MGIIDAAMKSLGSAHIASVFKTETEQLASAAPFVLGGLDRNEKVVYILDAHSKDELAERLMGARDVHQALEARRIEFLTAEETYLKGGAFSPERMVALLDSMERDALAEGYSGVRGAGEMTWCSSKAPGAKALMQYEALLNQRYPRSTMSLLCQYDENRFGADLLLDAVKTHPRVIIKGEICSNPYYLQPDEFLSGMRGALPREVFERTCSDILKRTRFSEIHRLELHDMRQVSRRMSVIGGLVIDDIQNQLDVMGFYTELALEAAQEPSAIEYLEKLEGTRTSLQRRLDFIKSYKMVGELEPKWHVLRDVFERVYQRVGVDGLQMELSVGSARVYADGLFEKAVEAMVVNAPDVDGRRDKVAVRFAEVGGEGLLSIQRSGKGVPENFKNRIFECGYTYGRCEGFDLFLAREILRSTGITVKETGVPGKCTRFEVCIPRERYAVE